MNRETIKKLRERADEMISAGIANKDELFAALPVITELQAKADGAKKNLAAAVRALTARASTAPSAGGIATPY